MYKRPINFLTSIDPNAPLPNTPAPSGEPPKKKKPIIIWAVIIVGLLAGALFLRYLSAVRGQTYYTLLHPKKVGFLETVKNFIFNRENVLQGQDEDRINILLL